MIEKLLWLAFFSFCTPILAMNNSGDFLLKNVPGNLELNIPHTLPEDVLEQALSKVSLDALGQYGGVQDLTMEIKHDGQSMRLNAYTLTYHHITDKQKPFSDVKDAFKKEGLSLSLGSWEGSSYVDGGELHEEKGKLYSGHFHGGEAVREDQQWYSFIKYISRIDGFYVELVFRICGEFAVDEKGAMKLVFAKPAMSNEGK